MSKINLDVKIITVKLTKEEVIKYAEIQRKEIEAGKNLTLNDYLRNSNNEYRTSNHIIIADLSDIEFAPDKTASQLNLEGADFSGVIFNNTSFIKCNLTNVNFCDTDLNNTFFSESKLTHVDFRGSDLSICKFDEAYRDYSAYGKSRDLEGICYSFTAPQGREYANIKSDMLKNLELKKLIRTQEIKVNELYEGLGYGERLRNTPKVQQYNEELKKLDELRKGQLPQKSTPVTFSLINIFGSTTSIFDPSYIRGSDFNTRKQDFKYIRLSREDVEKYLELIKETPDLSLNDYAKRKLPESEIENNTRYIADFSATGNLDNSFNRVDLTRLDFTRANLQGANFVGADLTESNFDNTNISNATFEGAILNNARFNETIARDTNFAGTDISYSQINNSDFKRAFMPRSNAHEAIIENSDFQYAIIRNAQWNDLRIDNCNFDSADMQGISLANADIRKTDMQHAILNDAILHQARIIESDFRNAFMQNVEAQRTKWQNVALNEISARGINLSDAEIDNLSKLDGANLEEAIFNRLNAEGVSFINANMDGIEAESANFKAANLENVSVRFANLSKSILDLAIANHVDMTGSSLINASASAAKLTEAKMQGVNATGADFTDALFAEADLRNCTFYKAILDKVNMEKAKVNANTNLAGALIDGATGQLLSYDEHDTKTSITIKEQKKLSEEIHRGKNLTWYQKGLGNSIKFFASGGNKLKDTIKVLSSYGSKYFKYIAIIIGVGAGLTFAAPLASIIGVSFLTAASITIVAGGVAGIIGSKYIKKIGVGGAIGGSVAAVLTANPLATAIGVAAGEIVDKTVEKVTGVGLSAGTAIGVTGAVIAGGLGIIPIAAGVIVGYGGDVAVKTVTGQSTSAYVKDLGNGVINLCEKGVDKYCISPELEKQIESANIMKKTCENELIKLKDTIVIPTLEPVMQKRILVQHTSVDTIRPDKLTSITQNTILPKGVMSHISTEEIPKVSKAQQIKEKQEKVNDRLQKL